MNMTMWQDKVHNLAKEKGWWVPLEDDPKNMTPDILASKLMLMVTELAEACEEVRQSKPDIYFEFKKLNLGKESLEYMGLKGEWSETKISHVTVVDIERAVHAASFGNKPEGTLIELADCVIRIMDLCGFMGWNLEHAIWLKHEYNKSRAIRHGGKAL